MSISREEITIKEFTSGTTLAFFSTHLTADTTTLRRDSSIEYVPTIIWLNNFGTPVKMTTFDGNEMWAFNGDNNYVPITELSNNHITGYSYVKDFSYIIEPERIEGIKASFTSQINSSLTGATPVNSTGVVNVDVQVPPHIDYVFHNYHEIDDFFVNIKLKRTFGTLDTFNVYNNLVNSMPTQEAETGVVFGRLMALQNIKDSEGNNIRIPLRNVPVGIFNTSDDYPTSSSVSDNGDRLFLNLKESSTSDEYFNIESFNLDKNKLLRSASQFTEVPPQYKYITTTNDEGEFVIYDAPVGTQIVVFEVDLLKQGLTRDEIALNFFPFPPDDDAILDQIPNFSFKQFPIDVIPAWGTIQTGYTELDVTVNMDLRKWTTYIFPPTSLFRQRLESSVASNAANTVKVEIRDMSKENYPKTEIKLAEIPNDLDKVSEQQYNWHLEFAQIKNKVEYFKFGCHVLKLPANIYDPNGFKTDRNGIPTINKGVWLSAYQLKIYSNGLVSRKTGTINAWNGSGYFTKSHFDINHSPSVADTSPSPPEGAGLGFFPYEKPWTAEYPSSYSIPKKPTDIRYQYDVDRTPSSTPGIYYLDEPAYNDGDLVGLPVFDYDDVTGGFGSQSAFGVWFGNRISQVATKNIMYKYERGVAWNETYANGYEPSNPGYLRFAGVSHVDGGEKYQRLESGYGYFLKPSGWPRIMRTTWGADTYFGPDISFGSGLGGDSENPGPGTTTSVVSGGIWGSVTHQNDVYNLNNVDLALVLDSTALIKQGTLEFYRIVDSNPNNLNVPQTFVIPTSVRINDGISPARCYNFTLTNTGEITVSFVQAFRGPIQTPSGVVFPGGIVTIAPGQNISAPNPADVSGVIDPQDIVGWCTHPLPGNSEFNPSTNRYDKAKYQFRIVYNGAVHVSADKYVNINVQAKTTPDIWYLKTSHTGGAAGRVSLGMNADYGGDPTEEVWSAFIETNNSQYDS
ncbi:MAG: hypothetical protein AABY15_04240 [Nanoarchaeota archaeon]